MQPVGELGRQESIDKPMAPDPAEPRKSRRDDLHPVVSAAAWTRACMAGVPVGFVDDVEEKRLEPLRQTADDSFLHGHRPLSRLAFFAPK